MIKINKQEKEAIEKKFGKTVHITIGNRQSSHKKYWVEETPKVKKFLKNYKMKLPIIYRYGGK